MRAGLFLLVITLSAGAIGYMELRHQAERETLRAEVSRLDGRLEKAERLAKERAAAMAAVERDGPRTKVAKAELAELEAQILDAAADLAMLESDRSVARDRADKALLDLKDQVRALTMIEMDMGALGKRRHRIAEEVQSVEKRLQQAEVGAAERQKRSEALERDVAELAIRKETLLANLGAAERTMAANALANMVEKSVTGAAVPSKQDSAPKPAPVRQPPAPIVERAVVEDGDRSRGLYQFGSLSADPSEVAGSRGVAGNQGVTGGQGGLPPSSTLDDLEARNRQEEQSRWAEDQYLLGLRLLSTAERNSGTRELNDAILAFKAVLGEWPKQRDPMRWAIARSDFGYALALLGKRQRNASVLEQATAACRDALDQFKQEETPLLWAAAQHHLGVSLGGLADVKDDPDLRKASINALEKAIAAFKDIGAEKDARKVERRLREASAQVQAE